MGSKQFQVVGEQSHKKIKKDNNQEKVTGFGEIWLTFQRAVSIGSGESGNQF